MKQSVEEILVEYQHRCSSANLTVDKFPDITDSFADRLRDAVGSADNTVRAFTVKELLATPAIKHNQSVLSRFLGINRGTLRKYMNDTNRTRHVCLYMGGEYIFMATSHGSKE